MKVQKTYNVLWFYNVMSLIRKIKQQTKEMKKMGKGNMLKQKTTWTGIAAVIAAIGGYFTGSMTPAEAIQTGLMGLAAIFVRQAIAK